MPDWWRTAWHIPTPTVILHSEGDQVCHVENARFLASTIPDAKFVERTRTERLACSKAANLADLLQAGYPVPIGWVLTTRAQHLPAEGYGLPFEVEMALRMVLEESGAIPLAVRSSAISEDLMGESFAGRYETTLGVRGLEQLGAAVRACWNSLRSERAVSYRHGGADGGGMAVLIQPMIQGQAAGVAFSAHPVTGAREWAMEGDALQLLQARPITSLPEPPIEPIQIQVEIPSGYWEHDASHFPTASYPIDSIVPELVSAGVESWANEFGYLFDGIEFRDIGGWTYQRLRPIGGKDGPDLPGWMMWLLVRTVPMLRRRISIAREAVGTDKPGRFVRT